MSSPLDQPSHEAEDGRGTGYAITVEFEVAEEGRAEFLRLLRENAAETLRQEPGCRRFDVLSPAEDNASSVLLYEIYDDEPAFQAHLKTQHFDRFDRATETFVRRKTVKHFQVREGWKPWRDQD